MAKKSKPPRRPAPPKRTAPASSTHVGGRWTPGTGKGMARVRSLHNKAMAVHGYRPKGSR